VEEKEKEERALSYLRERAYRELKQLDEELKVSLETAQRVEEKERQLKEQIEKMKEEEQNLRIRLRETELRMEKTREDIERLRREREETEGKIRGSAEEVEKLRRMKAVEQDTLQRERAYLKEVEEELRKIRRRIEDILRAKGYVESKLASAEAAAEIFREIKGVYGTVGDLLTVRDPEHIKAIEAAGGGRLKYVVVENEDVAKECIDLLKKKNLGRMSFIPLNRIRSDFSLPPYPRVKGAVDFAINLVDYEERFERAVRFALSDTLVVEDFESAKRIGTGSYRMVTLEGEIFEKSGVITGLGRRFYEEEKKKLDAEEEELREKEQDTLIKLRALRSEIAEKEGVLKILESDAEETGHNKLLPVLGGGGKKTGV